MLERLYARRAQKCVEERVRTATSGFRASGLGFGVLRLGGVGV